MLSEKSKSKLEGVNEKLISVVEKASEDTEVEFIVTCGMRTEAEQKVLFEKKLTKTMKSMHLVGRAVDLAPIVDGQVRWDWPAFYPMAKAMKKAAQELGIVIEWGGDWITFKDGPHFQLGPKE